MGGTESRIMLFKISEVSVIMMRSVALSDLYLHKTSPDPQQTIHHELLPTATTELSLQNNIGNMNAMFFFTISEK